MASTEQRKPDAEGNTQRARITTVWTISIGRETLGGAVATAVGMLPFHLVGTWLLAGLFWWPGRKLRASLKAFAPVQTAHKRG